MDVNDCRRNKQKNLIGYRIISGFDLIRPVSSIKKPKNKNKTKTTNETQTHYPPSAVV